MTACRGRTATAFDPPAGRRLFQTDHSVIASIANDRMRVKAKSGHPERQPGTEPGADDGRDTGPQGEAPVQSAVAVIAPHAADVLRQDADAVRAVGDGRRQPQEEQDRQREERSASGDDVQRAGDEAGAGEEDEFQGEWHDGRS